MKNNIRDKRKPNRERRGAQHTSPYVDTITHVSGSVLNNKKGDVQNNTSQEALFCVAHFFASVLCVCDALCADLVDCLRLGETR